MTAAPAWWARYSSWVARRPAVFTVALCAVAAAVMFAVYPVEATDLKVYMHFGRLVAEGNDDIYAPTDVFPFTYPPFAAVLFATVTWIPWWARAVGLLLVSGLCLATFFRTSVGQVAEDLGRDRRATQLAWLGLLPLLFAAEPLAKTFFYGQINLVLALLLGLDLLTHRLGRWRGVGVGIATGVKLTPGIFLLYLLLTRQWRAAAVAAGTTVGTMLLGLAVLPHSTVDFFTRAMLDDSRPALLGPEYASNQSWDGLLWRVVGEGGNGVVRLVLVGLTLVGAGWLLLRLHRRGLTAGAVVATGFAGLLVSPISWTHHWFWILTAVVVLLGYAARAARPSGVDTEASVGEPRPRLALAGRIIAALWAFTALTWTVWWLPHEFHREFSTPWPLWPVQNIDVLLAVATLAWLAILTVPGHRDFKEAP